MKNIFKKFFSNPAFAAAGFDYSSPLTTFLQEPNLVYRDVLVRHYKNIFTSFGSDIEVSIYHGSLHAWAVLDAVRMLGTTIGMHNPLKDTAEYAAIFHDIDYDVCVPDYVNTAQAVATALRFHHYNRENLPAIDTKVVSSAILNTTFNKELKEFEFKDELDFSDPEREDVQFSGFRCTAEEYYSQPYGTHVHWMLRDADLLGFIHPNWPDLLYSLAAELNMEGKTVKEIVRINCDFLKTCRMRTVKGKELMDKYIKTCEEVLNESN